MGYGFNLKFFRKNFNFLFLVKLIYMLYFQLFMELTLRFSKFSMRVTKKKLYNYKVVIE
jgi:hypothetical protein